MELVCSVNSIPAARAAVSAGADGLRLGLSGFSRFGLPATELIPLAAFCRARDVRLSVRLDGAIPHSHFREAADAAATLARAGVSVFAVSDVGLLCALRSLLPQAELEAAEPAFVSDAAGAQLLSGWGAGRLLLPPQLSLRELESLCGREGVRSEVTVCGPVCAAIGPCRMNPFLDGGQGCGEQCRAWYGWEGGALRPALADILLYRELPELERAGVSAVQLRAEGRRTAAAGLMVRVFRRALDEGKCFDADLRSLSRCCFPAGTSNALYRGTAAQAGLAPRPRRCLLRSGQRLPPPETGEFQRVPVRMQISVRANTAARLLATDESGRSAGASGPVPTQAAGEALNPIRLQTRLYNTLGTPFLCTGTDVALDPGLELPSADVSRMVHTALDRLLERRAVPPEAVVAELPPLAGGEHRLEAPDITVSVSCSAQLTPALAALKPRVLYVPLEVLLENPSAVTPFWENETTAICAVLPGRYAAGEAPTLYRALRSLRELQVEEVQVESLNAVLPARLLGFRLRGGLGLEAANAWSLQALQQAGFASALLSPTLPLEELRSLPKNMDTELPAYGRIPLLLAEGRLPLLLDRRGRRCPTQDRQGRSLLLSPDKLFLADRLRELAKLGLWCLHLRFTTESPRECVAITERYLGLGSYTPKYKTKGSYYETKTHIGFRFSPKKGAAGNAGRF